MPQIESDQILGPCENHVRGILWLLRQAIRWTVLMLLVLLEPLIRTALCGFALLGTFTAVLIRLTANRTDFPFWGILALSLSCMGVLMVYYATIRALSR